MKKRFQLFSDNNHYPNGGMCDHAGEGDTLKDTIALALEVNKTLDIYYSEEPNPFHSTWFHIYDVTLGKVVANNSDYLEVLKTL